MDAHKIQVGSEILHYPFLVEEDNAKLVTLLSNYLSLGQIELARATLRQISSRSPQQAKSLLKCLITTKPPSQWYVSIPPPSCACSPLFKRLLVGACFKGFVAAQFLRMPTWRGFASMSSHCSTVETTRYVSLQWGRDVSSTLWGESRERKSTFWRQPEREEKREID